MVRAALASTPSRRVESVLYWRRPRELSCFIFLSSGLNEGIGRDYFVLSEECMKNPVVCMIVIALLCCGISAAFAGQYNILVIPKSDPPSPFWNWVKQGALEAGKERGANVIYRSPRLPYKLGTQAGLIKEGISEHVDAIVLAPDHGLYTKNILEEAVERGIKVVIIDSDVAMENRESFVASDNYQAGRKAADFLFSLIEEEDSVLLLRFKRDNVSTVRREAGFVDVMVRSPVPVILIEVAHVEGDMMTAYTSTVLALKRYPSIRAVFSPAEATTVGALRAVEELGLSRQVRIVGFDYTPEIHRALEAGKLAGVMVQNPYQIGHLGVMTACDALDGKSVEKRIVTDTLLVTDVKELPEYLFR